MSGPYFVAEVSSNHNNDLERCRQFIDTAADIGCQAVKFQLFKIDELFAPEILAHSEKHRQRKTWELPVDFLPELAKHCRQRDIAFSCTPFYLKAVEELTPYVEFFKIASYELLWHDLLRTCAQSGKPVVLSTGMATMGEIQKAVQIMREEECKFTLLHCVSGYPVPPSECNLAAIRTMRESFNCPVGWSDHSVSPAVICRAIHRWDAPMIEFHLDLDGTGNEFNAGHCWLPEQMAAVIAASKTLSEADGNGIKEPTPVEMPDRAWRADPVDGLRPLTSIRESFHG